jgi:uncharacterized caspase-like protein
MQTAIGGRSLAALVLTAFCLNGQDTTKGVKPVRPDQTPEEFRETTKVAFLVGISVYPPESHLTPLKYAAQDASDLNGVLSVLGYKTIVVADKDATKRYVLNKIDELKKEIKEPGKATVIFAFSGHGAEPKGLQDPYLATWGVTAETMDEGLSLSELKSHILDLHPKRVMMFIDACRNEIKKSGPEVKLPPQFANSEGLKIFLATKPGQYSFEKDGLKNGVFTHYIVKGINGEAEKNGLVTFDALRDYVTDQVKKEQPGQTPYAGGDSEGDFVIVAGNPCKRAGTRRAFVAGVSKYQRASVDKAGKAVLGADGKPTLITHMLPGAALDAATMTGDLKDMCFDVTKVPDPVTAAELKQHFSAFVKTLGSSDTALFYFAGDGGVSDGEAYALASDADFGTDNQRVAEMRGASKGARIEDQLAISSVVRELSSNRVGANLVILDMGLPIVAGDTDEKRLELSLARENSMVLIAASPGQMAREQKDSGGIFTIHFVNQMRQPVSITQAFGGVNGLIVRKTTGQQKPLSVGYLAEESFYLRPK